MNTTLAFAALLLLQAQPPRTAREALAPFNDLVGTWKGTGTPVGTRTQQQEGFWIESLAVGWQFKSNDAWMSFAFEKSKNFSSGELRYLKENNQFQLDLVTLAKKKLTFTGPMEKNVLTLLRSEGDETQQLVFTFLHSNRFLYRYEEKPAGKALFAKRYSVGATKEGVPFVAGDGKPECIVSGGAGTSAVTFQGKTFYVCCSGCRTEFNENPAKYVKEYEDKKKTAK